MDRLASVVFLDITGSSKLPDRDQVEARRRLDHFLSDLRRDLDGKDYFIEERGGDSRVIVLMGEFFDAVRIAERVRGGVLDGEIPPVHLGLHLGTVALDEAGLPVGSALNQAQRVADTTTLLGEVRMSQAFATALLDHSSELGHRLEELGSVAIKGGEKRVMYRLHPDGVQAPPPSRRRRRSQFLPLAMTALALVTTALCLRKGPPSLPAASTSGFVETSPIASRPENGSGVRVAQLQLLQGIDRQTRLPVSNDQASRLGEIPIDLAFRGPSYETPREPVLFHCQLTGFARQGTRCDVEVVIILREEGTSRAEVVFYSFRETEWHGSKPYARDAIEQVKALYREGGIELGPEEECLHFVAPFGRRRVAAAGRFRLEVIARDIMGGGSVQQRAFLDFAQ